MLINKHNLTIAEHCAAEELSGFITNGLQFTKAGTIAINRSYSVAVSALQTSDDGETVTGCIPPDIAKELQAKAGDGDLTVEVAKLPLMAGRAPRVELPDNPVQFEITLSANFLFTLARSAINFDGDAIVRLQFTGPNDPVRMDARNKATGQKWEALLMPRKAGGDAERFAEPDPLAEALAEAQRLAGI